MSLVLIYIFFNCFDVCYNLTTINSMCILSDRKSFQGLGSKQEDGIGGHKAQHEDLFHVNQWVSEIERLG